VTINRRDNVHIFADSDSKRTRCDRYWYVMSFAITKREATEIGWVRTGRAMCAICVRKEQVKTEQYTYADIPESKISPYR